VGGGLCVGGGGGCCVVKKKEGKRKKGVRCEILSAFPKVRIKYRYRGAQVGVTEKEKGRRTGESPS